jgi:AAA domain
MTVKRGSLWRKWDLQIHTPASIRHKYPGTVDEQWQQFLAGLASLPEDFKAVAISDYLFLDGYVRLQEEKAAGRLQNLKLILPAIELRLKAFGGTESKIRRVNAHIVFSDDLDPETIQAQFYGALIPKFKLAKGSEWKGVVTRQSLEDFGKSIIESVPREERARFASPLEEGFNNLTVELDDIQQALDTPYFRGQYLFAVGKTEWAAIKWNNQSVADKKNIINTADFVLMSAQDAVHYEEARSSLSAAGVNDLLLDCSDAHTLASSTEKDRLGNSLTWINAEPTFRGLQHALLDPERIFVGDSPERLVRLRRAPQLFIDSLCFTKKPHSDLSETWFDQLSLPLNPGLVSIIGNPGTGKSALAESIALALSNGSVPHPDHYSFLSGRRFCEPRENKAQHFEVTLRLQDAKELTACLDDDPLQREGPGICFLPQNYIEQLCADPRALDEFRAELDEVVFSHVPKTEREGQPSFQKLVQRHVAETQGHLERLRLNLRQVNKKVQDLEAELSDENAQQLQKHYEEFRRRLFSHRQRLPIEPTKPKKEPELEEQVAACRRMRDFFDTTLGAVTGRLESLTSRLTIATRLRERLQNLDEDIKTRVAGWSEELQLLGLVESAIIRVEIDYAPIDSVVAKLTAQTATLEKWTDREHFLSLSSQRARVQRRIERIRSRMEEPSRVYQTYLEELKTWRDARRELIGDATTPNSLLYFRARREALKRTVPQELAAEKRKRLTTAKQILTGTYSLCSAYRKIHQRAQDFVSSNPALQQLGIRFEVTVAPKDFRSRFFDLIHHGRKGSFQGTKEGRRRLAELLEKHDFSDEASALAFVDEVVAYLERDYGTAAFEQRSLPAQLTDGKETHEIFDLLYSFEYLEPSYMLQMGGRSLGALSPGERGLLLLVFYLLVHQDKRPLVIDQPEGNLDNESIFRTLVPCIRDAKRARQIIIVTHNPILAVVCDSEQIIRARLDKANGPTITYSGGAIEDETINKWLVDVLEGTWPAFDRRKGRYIPAEGVSEVPITGTITPSF